MSAIVQVGNQQFKVGEGDTVKVALISKEVGESVSLDKVLAVIDGDNVTFGSPFVSGASVSATIVGHGKEKKIIIFRYKSKKRRRVTTGHRQNFTTLKIDKIVSA